MTHVLIVDDKAENLYYLSALLTAHGCTVETACHGAEALVKARQATPDLIVSDLLMPVMDGYTLLRHWKADPRLKRVPFIVYTATYTEAEDERLALNLGADAFILKPAEPDDFLARLREVQANTAAAVPVQPKNPVGDENALLRVYSETLIRKLEEKTLQLEETNRALERDIAERKLAEAALRESEERFRSLLQSVSSVAVQSYAPDGTTRYWNRASELLYGYTAEEAIGRNLLDLIIPEEMRPQVIAAMQTMAETGEPIPSSELALKRKDGSLITVFSSHTTVRVPGREPEMFCFDIDLTERKAAEGAMRESEERFRQLAENINEVFWVSDLEKRLLYLSPIYEKIWGRSRAAIYDSHHTWLETIHPEDRERVAEAVRTKQVRGDYDETYRILRPDGAVRCIHDRAFPVANERGENYRIVGTAEDITERKVAEERIAEQAALLDQTQDAIIVRDLEHRIVFWSKGAERLYGWTAAEAVNRRVEELVRPDAATFQEALKAVLRVGVWGGEIHTVTKTGAKIVLESRWTLLRDAGNRPKSILDIATDITERKKLEQQFLRAQRMESIGTLAGGVAHDLNNLLTPILMGVGVLRLTPLIPESLQILDSIEQSARRGTDLVKQVLSFARGVEGSRMAVPVAGIVHEIEAITRNTFPRNITFGAAVAADTWPVIGDPTQLNQVLMNLCVNARDAMPGGGNLMVATRNVVLNTPYAALQGIVPPGRYVVLEVADTGTGIPKQVLERIFEPFFTTKDVGKGTGLGLSTVLGIVRSHGGCINVESVPGRGTTFRIFLPAEAEAAEGPAGPVTDGDEHTGGLGEGVLVVDDDSTVLDITRQTLETFGYRVFAAEDGTQALAIYARHRAEIAVVLTDVMMPVMDGIALSAALRRINPTLAIVAASGLDEHAAALAEVGVKRFLAKPFSAHELLRTLRGVLAAPAGGQASV